MLPLVFLLAGHLAVVGLRQLPGHLLRNSILSFLCNPVTQQRSKRGYEQFWEEKKNQHSYKLRLKLQSVSSALSQEDTVRGAPICLTCVWERTWRSCRRKPPGRCWPESWHHTGLQTEPGPCAKSSRRALRKETQSIHGQLTVTTKMFLLHVVWFLKRR